MYSVMLPLIFPCVISTDDVLTTTRLTDDDAVGATVVLVLTVLLVSINK